MAKTALSVSFSSLAVLGACSTVPPAAVSEEVSSRPAFRQALRDATTDALVVNLAAHPDDEANTTLMYLRRAKGLRIVTMYSTSGGGGQNAISREIGPDLARLRTRETLAAASLSGTEVRWLGFSDFGYSKSADEAFAKWGKELYVERLTAVIDEVQPDLVFSSHGLTGGHGHHQASARGLREVLTAKANAGNVIPIYQRGGRGGRGAGARGAGARGAAGRGVDPRTAVGRRGNRGGRGAQRRGAGQGTPTPQPPTVVFPVGQVDDVTGLSYTRQANNALSKHRTQGMGRGNFQENPERSDSWRIVYPEGLDGSDLDAVLGSVFRERAFLDLASAEDIDVVTLRAQFAAFGEDLPVSVHVARAREMLPEIRQYRQLLLDTKAGVRLARRIDALERIVLEGSGIRLEGSVSQEEIAEGGVGEIEVRVYADANTGGAVEGLTATLDRRLAYGRDGALTLSYGPLMGVDGDAVAPAWFRPMVNLEVNGLMINREVPVQYTPVHRVAMEFKRPVRYIPVGSSAKTLEASLSIDWNGDGPLDETLQLLPADGITATVVEASMRLPGRSKGVERQVVINLPGESLVQDEAIVTTLETGVVELRLRPVDARPPESLNVGLIRGPDDSLQFALQDLGIRFKLLDEETLPSADLSEFTVIVLDIRVNRHRPDLIEHKDRLLEWCEKGGRVLSFYHKNGEWNVELAPYELRISGQRVSEEDATVTFLNRDHPLWNHPNTITEADFTDWVQERGLNFPRTWDENWLPLMEMADQGEEPLQGGLLYSEFGEGDYVYCSLAVYRQLRLGNPGAARLLVNLLTQK